MFIYDIESSKKQILLMKENEILRNKDPYMIKSVKICNIIKCSYPKIFTFALKTVNELLNWPNTSLLISGK